MDLLHLLAGCRKRRLNQAPLNLRGLIWLLMMDWSDRENIRKRGPSWEPFRKNSALCRWQVNQSWFKERRNPQAPNGSTRGNRKKHHITVRDLLRFLTSSQRFSTFHSILVRNTRGFTGGWTMDPSVAWFYEGQLCLHRNWNWYFPSHLKQQARRHTTSDNFVRNFKLFLAVHKYCEIG